MSLLLEDLRCNIVGRTTNGFLHISLMFDAGGQSKVANLDIHLVVDENITKFKVAMNDTLGVNVNHRTN